MKTKKIISRYVLPLVLPPGYNIAFGYTFAYCEALKHGAAKNDTFNFLEFSCKLTY